MSSVSPSATLASTSPVAGLMLSNVLPETASTHFPPISIFLDRPSRKGWGGVIRSTVVAMVCSFAGWGSAGRGRRAATLRDSRYSLTNIAYGVKLRRWIHAWVTRRSTMTRALLFGLSGALLALAAPAVASAEDLVLYGAGSLREGMTQIARDFQAKTGTAVRPEFGPSGV